MSNKYIQMLFICFVAIVLLGMLLVAKPAHAAEHMPPEAAQTDAEVEGVTTFIDTQFGNVCYIVTSRDGSRRNISCVPLPKE